MLDSQSYCSNSAAAVSLAPFECSKRKPCIQKLSALHFFSTISKKPKQCNTKLSSLFFFITAKINLRDLLTAPGILTFMED